MTARLDTPAFRTSTSTPSRISTHSPSSRERNPAAARTANRGTRLCSFQPPRDELLRRRFASSITHRLLTCSSPIRRDGDLTSGAYLAFCGGQRPSAEFSSRYQALRPSAVSARDLTTYSPTRPRTAISAAFAAAQLRRPLGHRQRSIEHDTRANNALT